MVKVLQGQTDSPEKAWVVQILLAIIKSRTVDKIKSIGQEEKAFCKTVLNTNPT